MNKILTKRVSLFLLILWMIVIFIFSSMSGDTSATLSKTILSGITGSSLKASGSFNLVHFIFRKLAHLFEYFVLSALAYNYLRFYINKERTLYISTLIFTVVCSCLDEIHQIFTFERSARLYDILIDSLATIIFLIIIIIKNNVTKRKSN